MSSSKLILFFIGIILLIVVILSSNRIGVFLRQKFGRFLPANIAQSVKPTVTPTPKISAIPSPTVYKAIIDQTYYNGTKSTNSNEIPATGPQGILYIFLSGGLGAGIVLNRIASKNKKG